MTALFDVRRIVELEQIFYIYAFILSPGENLKMSEDDLAFYDTLEGNDCAVKVLALRSIAQEIVRRDFTAGGNAVQRLGGMELASYSA